MAIEIIIDGVTKTVTKQELFDLAAKGIINPQTTIQVNGTFGKAGQVKDIVFGSVVNETIELQDGNTNLRPVRPNAVSSNQLAALVYILAFPPFGSLFGYFLQDRWNDAWIYFRKTLMVVLLLIIPIVLLAIIFLRISGGIIDRFFIAAMWDSHVKFVMNMHLPEEMARMAWEQMTPQEMEQVSERMLEKIMKQSNYWQREAAWALVMKSQQMRDWEQLSEQDKKHWTQMAEQELKQISERGRQEVLGTRPSYSYSLQMAVYDRWSRHGEMSASMQQKAVQMIEQMEKQIWKRLTEPEKMQLRMSVWQRMMRTRHSTTVFDCGDMLGSLGQDIQMPMIDAVMAKSSTKISKRAFAESSLGICVMQCLLRMMILPFCVIGCSQVIQRICPDWHGIGSMGRNVSLILVLFCILIVGGYFADRWLFIGEMTRYSSDSIWRSWGWINWSCGWISWLLIYFPSRVLFIYGFLCIIWRPYFTITSLIPPTVQQDNGQRWEISIILIAAIVLLYDCCFRVFVHGCLTPACDYVRFWEYFFLVSSYCYLASHPLNLIFPTIFVFFLAWRFWLGGLFDILRHNPEHQD